MTRQEKSNEEPSSSLEQNQTSTNQEKPDISGDQILYAKNLQPQKSPAKKRNLPAVRKKSSDVKKVDLLQKYFEELRNYPLLSREEEYDLAVEFQETQDQDIAFRLTTSNLRLVVKIAMEYQNAATNLLDLIQEGNVGLMQAVKKYDPFRGIRLSSYAQWWIRAYILKFLVNNARMVKVGTTQAQRKLFFNLKKEKEKLEALGFKPEPKLLASRLDVKESEVIEMEQRLSGGDLSLDAPVGDDKKGSVGDLFPAQEATVEEQVMENELFKVVRMHMDAFSADLKDREKLIWDKRLASDEPITLQEIGDIFGVTRERARQIEKDVANRFKDYLKKRVPDLEGFDLSN